MLGNSNAMFFKRIISGWAELARAHCLRQFADAIEAQYLQTMARSLAAIQLSRREQQCHVEIKALIPISKNERPNTSKRATRIAVFPSKEAKARAWATVNKESGGGKKSGSGRGKKENRSASKKGGKKAGAKKASSKKSSKKGGRKTSKK